MEKKLAFQGKKDSYPTARRGKEFLANVRRSVLKKTEVLEAEKIRLSRRKDHAVWEKELEKKEKR